MSNEITITTKTGKQIVARKESVCTNYTHAVVTVSTGVFNTSIGLPSDAGAEEVFCLCTRLDLAEKQIHRINNGKPKAGRKAKFSDFYSDAYIVEIK